MSVEPKKWRYLDTEVFVDQKMVQDRMVDRVMKCGVDVTDGVTVTQRVWTRVRNDDGDYELAQTPVGLSFRVRNKEDVFMWLKQVSEVVRYIQN